jgi:Asp-tRNA(Asn)/Glu-tRNA(Gln) amidotransferase A subunit family amidase
VCGGGRLGVPTELGLGPRVDREVAALVENAARVFELLSVGVTPVTIPFEPHNITCADLFYQVRALAEITGLPENSQRAAEVVWSRGEPVQTYTATKHYQDYL